MLQTTECFDKINNTLKKGYQLPVSLKLSTTATTFYSESDIFQYEAHIVFRIPYYLGVLCVGTSCSVRSLSAKQSEKDSEIQRSVLAVCIVTAVNNLFPIFGLTVITIPFFYSDIVTVIFLQLDRQWTIRQSDENDVRNVPGRFSKANAGRYGVIRIR